MNFDEMDIEPKSEPPAGRRSSPQKFAKENKSHDEEPKWHQDSRPKYHNMEPHFSTVDNLMDDISKGQPLPPGMEDEITGPCQILKSLETFEHPLIGLEFLLELHNIVELKEPRYLCLLCDKRGDPRTILVHLTSQNHYLMYLRKYFRKFYSLIDKLPKSNECRGSVTSVTSHLIAKLEEKYGRLQPTATREDVVNVPEQRSMILQKIDGSVHFSESAEDAFLEDMLTIEYVQNPQLLQKNFPLKPKHATIEKPKEESKSLFNKISRNPSKKNIRNSRENTKNPREESPDVVFVGASRKPLSRNGRSRERSPRRIREMSLRRSRDRSPRRSRDMSLRRSRERSPHRVSERLPLRSRERSPLRGINRSPLRGVDRSPLRGIERSPLRSVNRSPMRGGVDRSPLRGIDRSPIRVIDRSPIRGIDRSPPRGVERSPLRGIDRSPIRAVERSPIRGVDRSPMRSRERSLLRGKERSPGLRMRSRSRHRSPSADRGRRRFISPSYYRSLRYQLSRSRSPQRHRSRSPHVERDRFYRRSPSPMSQMRARERSPMSSRYGGHRYRSPERSEREIRRVIVQRSPSPMSRSSEHASRYRGRSRSRERSPPFRGRRSRSRSRPRHELDVNSGPKPSVPVDSHSKPKEKGRADLNMNRAYIREAKEVEEKLNRDMEGYTETPESHPAYQDEWKKFWCAKFKEIQSEGKEDPHKYDYKPEWITFWNTRVKELFDEELKSKITALKSKYGISGEAKEDKSGEPKKTSAANSPGDDEKKPVIDIKTMWKELTGCEIKETPANAKRRSLSPWEDNDDVAGDKEAASKKDDAKKTSNLLLDEGSTQAISPVSLSSISDTESPRRPYRRTRSRSRSRSAQRSSRDYPFKEEYRKPPSKKIHFENPLNIITVLRQLSVLEFQLGSYASHVISLLTSGLTMERIKPQSSIDLLTKDNILFLELVKEKLKGQLLAGVVPKSMVKATLFCIKNTEELLQLVPKLKPTSPPPIPAPPPGLLYGAGVDPSQAPPGGSALAYGSHVYGHNYGGYPRPPFKHFNRKDRYPYRKPSPKRSEDAKTGRRISDEFPFRNNEPAAEQKPAAAVDEEIPIDKNLIALQIAEVLTQQGRSDVSNEELQALINTVVENLKQEQKMKAQQNNAAQLKDMTIPAVMNALSANAAAPANLGNVVAAAAAALTVPTIPAGFNLNDVSSSTLALLQDAYANVSVLSANQTSAIEDLSEADLIQMLRNFKSIPRVKQEKLIEYLRKLEVTNPERVEELKKYVNVL